MNEGKADHGNGPRSTWVSKTRAAVMLIGFAWVPSLMIYGMLNETDHGRDFTFMMIGIFFMLAMLAAPALLFSVLLPTHKARLLGSPLFLIACFIFLLARDPSSHVQMPNFVGLMPWIFTGIAILVTLPDFPPASWLYRRLFSLISR